MDVIIMRASLTEVHLESLKTAHYISRVYNGIMKEQKNILLEICFGWAHFNGKQAQQMAKLIFIQECCQVDIKGKWKIMFLKKKILRSP